MPQSAVPILDIFASVTDPRHPSKVQHPLPIELWAKEKLSWLRHYLSLPQWGPVA